MIIFRLHFHTPLLHSIVKLHFISALLHSIFIHYFDTTFWYSIATPTIVGNACDTTRQISEKNTGAEKGSSRRTYVTGISKLAYRVFDLLSPTCHVHYVRIIITLAPSFLTRSNLRHRLIQGKAPAWPPTPSKRPREQAWPTLPRKCDSGVASPEHRTTRTRLQTLTH